MSITYNITFPSRALLRDKHTVISGSGAIHSEFGNFKIQEGDLYFFKKGEKYWVEGKNLFLIVVNAPKWTPEQHKIVD